MHLIFKQNKFMPPNKLIKRKDLLAYVLVLIFLKINLCWSLGIAKMIRGDSNKNAHQLLKAQT